MKSALITGGIAVVIIAAVTIIFFMQKEKKIVEAPIPDSPLVTIRVVVHTGSVDDPNGKEGLNAVTALTIGEGGTLDFTYKDIIAKLYPWAASISVQFDKEVTTYIGEVHRDHLDGFYELFSGLLLKPRFDREDFARNKENLKNAIMSTLRGNDDEELGKETLNVLMYEDHPYGHTVMGTESGLEAITLGDVRKFYKENYYGDIITIGLAGGYPKEFVKRIETDFKNGLPAGSAETILPESRQLKDIEVLIVEKECLATAISIGFPIDITRTDKDFYALMIANSYLGEHRTFNGRLMVNMREKRGLNYGDYSYIENFIQDGGTTFPVPNIFRSQQFFSIWIRPVQHVNAHFALRQAVRELQMLADNGITQEDFEATRNYLINYSKLYVQTASRRLGYLIDSKLYGTEYFIDKIEKELKTVTLEDVNAAVKKHLQYKNLAVGIVTQNGEDLKTKLLANEPSPITYSVKVDDAIAEEDITIMTYPLAINQEKIRVVPAQEMFKK